MSADVATARGNAVLAALPERDLRALVPHLREEPVSRGAVLYLPGEPVAAIWFPLIGVVSIVADLTEGTAVEVATIGREGVVGLPVFFGGGTPTERATVQVAGSALAMSAEDFRGFLANRDGPLHAAMTRYAQAMFTQLARNAACNRIHSVRQRAARWLLMTADRMASDTFELTQEFLAEMLAVRRPTVNDIAQTLADDGVISYRRGVITILDHDRLDATACDCYDVIREASLHAFDN